MERFARGIPARFELRRRLGAGSMGIVYEAQDRERGLPVAVKVLRALTPTGLTALKREFRSLRDLHHPNLLSLGELLGGAEGAALVVDARGAMVRLGIRRPERLLAVLAPGFP